ncbi:MAG: S-adenosylmethionine:tRNA ribosyltransferase-isomerase, partial [Fibrobacter sp.]|nr:S-adenosylmethionine:tRNA ribosyltransferase-isomerase [Fibrobacter sp.]
MEHNLSDYSFEFPQELIASRTAGKGKTRILHCPKGGGERRILKAPEIVELFKAGDCLVVNNTKVIPARLYGNTLHGGEVETLLVQAMIPAEDGSARYEAQVRPGKAFKVGRELLIAGVKTVVESV